MLGVGWTEMLVIGVVALIVIGPKDLPVVMRRVGQFAATIRRMGADFQRELNKTTGLNEITNLRNSVTAPLKATADAIRKEFNTTTSTGAVVPSGAIKPADPKSESVVNEIQAAAGMTPATGAVPAPAPVPPAASVTPEPAPAPLMTASAPVVVETPAKKPRASKPKAVASEPAAAAEISPAPAIAAAPVARKTRAPKVKAPAADTPVAVADIPPAAKKSATRQPIDSPAPVEAIAPETPKPRARKKTVAGAAPVVAETPAEAAAPAAKKPATRRASTTKKT